MLGILRITTASVSEIDDFCSKKDFVLKHTFALNAFELRQLGIKFVAKKLLRGTFGFIFISYLWNSQTYLKDFFKGCMLIFFILNREWKTGDYVTNEIRVIIFGAKQAGNSCQIFPNQRLSPNSRKICKHSLNKKKKLLFNDPASRHFKWTQWLCV
jgi:hypothetical protein